MFAFRKAFKQRNFAQKREVLPTKDTKKKKMREIIIKNRKETDVTDEALWAQKGQPPLRPKIKEFLFKFLKCLHNYIAFDVTCL